MKKDYKIPDILDLNRISNILESFSKITNTVTAILDLEGNILLKTGWREICTSFHRKNPETSQNCRKSDTVLAGKLSKGSSYNVYKCLNGLVDVAVPIIIKGKHVGNLFTGQFFFEPPDVEAFRAKAKKYNFNEKKYLEALTKVPVINENEIEEIVNFLLSVTEMLGEVGLNEINQIETNQALKESKTFNETLLNTSPDIIYVYDIQGRKNVYSNDGIMKVLGYTSQEMKKMGENLIQTLMNPDDFKTYISSIIPKYRIAKDNEFIEHSYRMRHKEGHWVWLNSKETVFSRNLKGEALQIFGIITDITESKIAQKELLKVHRILEETGNLAKVGGWEFNVKTGKGTWTKEVAKIHDLIPDDPTNMDIGLSFYTPESRQIIERAIRLAIDKGIPYNLELEMVTAKKNHKWVRTIGKPIIKKGKVTKITGSFQDITELKKTKDELIKSKEKAEESDKLKTAFLANMSHEIRTPLNGILGFTDLLREPGLTLDKRKKYIDIIEKSGKRMLNIISDLIDISKIETGQIEIAEESFSLNKLFEDLYTFFKPEAEKRGVTLNYEVSIQNIERNIISDKTKLTQVLVNLIGNALKFTKEGSIDFGYSHAGEQLTFYVKDSGIGISPEFQKRIFERFIQADLNPANSSEGSGLGLAISKAYIEKLGGEIWVESELGKGTTFYFYLPFKQSDEVSNQQDTNNSDFLEGFDKMSVLIVEDDEISYMYLEELLNYNNVKIVRAKNGQEAINLCKKNPDFDLVLMDVKMPVINGIEATKEIRKINAKLPILAQSAHINSNDIEKAVLAGCDDYISKPINKEELQSLIKKYLK